MHAKASGGVLRMSRTPAQVVLVLVGSPVSSFHSSSVYLPYLSQTHFLWYISRVSSRVEVTSYIEDAVPS